MVVPAVKSLIPAHLRRLRLYTDVRLTRPKRGPMSVDKKLELATFYDNACNLLEADCNLLEGGNPLSLDSMVVGLIRDHIEQICWITQV